MAKELRFGNPTCEYCGATYHMMQGHKCAFNQEAKLKVEKDRANKAEAELKKAKTTLRDQFAMAALSLYAHDGSYEPDLMARSAYEIADAMLKARAAIMEGE